MKDKEGSVKILLDAGADKEAKAANVSSGMLAIEYHA
jgi:hypothetical protein